MHSKKFNKNMKILKLILWCINQLALKKFKIYFKELESFDSYYFCYLFSNLHILYSFKINMFYLIFIFLKKIYDNLYSPINL